MPPSPLALQLPTEVPTTGAGGGSFGAAVAPRPPASALSSTSDHPDELLERIAGLEAEVKRQAAVIKELSLSGSPV